MMTKVVCQNEKDPAFFSYTDDLLAQNLIHWWKKQLQKRLRQRLKRQQKCLLWISNHKMRSLAW